MAFNHEKLIVYQRALRFNILVSEWTGDWDKKHAICDQLSRAAESALENIAMASAAYSAMKQRCLDYAIGSSLECAACLDLARVKRLVGAEAVCAAKEDLLLLVRMLVGLRKSWSNKTDMVREDPAEYGVGSGSDDIDKARDKVRDKVLFHHESLDVYRVAIEVAESLCCSDPFSSLSRMAFRRLDELLTSMVLNIAEGNGRFSDADQVRFLGTSHESAIKLAARLDLCAAQGHLPQDEVDSWKNLLERVALMTAAMVASIGRGAPK